MSRACLWQGLPYRIIRWRKGKGPCTSQREEGGPWHYELTPTVTTWSTHRINQSTLSPDFEDGSLEPQPPSVEAGNGIWQPAREWITQSYNHKEWILPTTWKRRKWSSLELLESNTALLILYLRPTELWNKKFVCRPLNLWQCVRPAIENECIGFGFSDLSLYTQCTCTCKDAS
jgi:hypothetical protein